MYTIWCITSSLKLIIRVCVYAARITLQILIAGIGKCALGCCTSAVHIRMYNYVTIFNFKKFEPAKMYKPAAKCIKSELNTCSDESTCRISDFWDKKGLLSFL